MRNAVAACGYTFLFNLVDATAGVLPVTRVNAEQDSVRKGFSFAKLNGVAKGAWMYYDARSMEGLPVGVQVVGGRLEEEKVLAVMERVVGALGESGVVYDLVEVD